MKAFFILIIGLLSATQGFAQTSTIAFDSNRDGDFEIFVMNSDGTGVIQLTDNEAEYDINADFSPDGSKIAFMSNRDGNYEIYVMNTDGSGQTNLTNNLYPDDGPDWSPDGTKITFTRWMGPDNQEIFVMNADGTNQIRLTSNSVNDCRPSWSPDGSKIAFSSGTDIYIMNPDGTGVTQITNSPGEDYAQEWSPDGARIAFMSDRDGDNEIYIMNTDGSNQVCITDNTDRDQLPIWSPDGTQIGFVSDHDGNYEIYIMNTDGTNQTRLTNNPYQDSIGSWWLCSLTLSPIIAPLIPNSINSEIQASAEYTHSCGVLPNAVWDWGDGTVSNGIVNDLTITGTHTYTQAGVYTVKLTATHDVTVEETFQYIVIYSSDEGFVTGGGWIMSPEGAYTPDPTLTGKANFGFVSKYKKGVNVPTGNTEFQFKAGDLNFRSSTYDWLVVAGAKAQYKGVGTINGKGDYKFMLKAIDADINETDTFDIDRFCIKIWEEIDDVEQVVYDNALGSEEDEDTTEIGGGSIKIHNENLAKRIADMQLPMEFALNHNYPNPFNPTTSINYAIPAGSTEFAKLTVYDMRGAVVKTLVERVMEPGYHVAIWDGTDNFGNQVSSGLYIYQLIAGKFTKSNKMILMK